LASPLDRGREPGSGQFRAPGREVIATRQLVEEWAETVVIPKLLVFKTPREAYLRFSEWLYSRVAVFSEETRTSSFEMEVFRRMLPRYDTFQMVWAYLPKQLRLPEVSK